MTEYPVYSRPLLERPKCPYCGYEPVNFSRTNADGEHNCWKCRRDYRIIEATYVRYLCLPIENDDDAHAERLRGEGEGE